MRRNVNQRAARLGCNKRLIGNCFQRSSKLEVKTHSKHGANTEQTQSKHGANILIHRSHSSYLFERQIVYEIFISPDQHLALFLYRIGQRDNY